jgi:hypothetical protein
MSEVPQIGTRSDDGYYWWDGRAWQPVGDQASGSTASGATADSVGTAAAAQGEQPAEVKLPERSGPIILFEPDSGSSTVAIFAHGVAKDTEIEPTSGVTLGYYSPHGDAVDANITWALDAPSHPPQASPDQPDGKWASYVLSTIGLGEADQAELSKRANEYGMAIAYVVDATSTETLVPMLAGWGYTEVRGVHCRETLGKTAEPVFGATTEVMHHTLVSDGWKDEMGDPVTDDTEIGEGELLTSPDGRNFKVETIDAATSAYTIAEYKGAG